MLAAFLESSMPAADVRAVVQDYIGYTLIPPSVLNLGISLVMVGRGGDGKGLLSSVTSQILHRHSTMAIDLGAKDGFSLEGIEASISLATVDELPINEAILSKDLKSAISCDSMSINRKGRKRLTVRPTARFMMGGNDLPRFDHGGAAALERRFIFVPFGARLSSTDRVANLENIIIEDESQSFLDWALIGALRVAERRVFDFAKLPDICRKMSGEAIEATDSTLGFIKEFAVGPSTAVMNKEKVYNDYLGWMSTERRGTHPLASQNFFKRLLSHLNVGEIEAPRGSELGRPRKVYLAYDQFPEVNAAPAAAAPSKTESATDDKPPFDD
jgi:phage/plasmid-associated DNA primase